MGSKDEKTNSAPVLPLEWEWEDGQTIWPCTDCYPWHLDLYMHPESGATIVREWHAVGCAVWERTGQA
jgi:hypothetical protein